MSEVGEHRGHSRLHISVAPWQCAREAVDKAPLQLTEQLCDAMAARAAAAGLLQLNHNMQTDLLANFTPSIRTCTYLNAGILHVF